MQQLFPAEGETVPRLRFAEFLGAGEWEVKKLGEISKITTGSSNREDSIIGSGEYTFFDRSQDIRTSNIYLFDGEAVIIAGEGQDFIPKYFTGKFDLHQRTYAIMDFVLCTGIYLFYFIYKFRGYFLEQAVGSTVKSLRLPMFKNMPISLPSSKEQQKIADCLSSLDELINLQTQKIATLKTHKKGMMQQLFPQNTNEGTV
jgi:type I restriction enzyme S subunit